MTWKDRVVELIVIGGPFGDYMVVLHRITLGHAERDDLADNDEIAYHRGVGRHGMNDAPALSIRFHGIIIATMCAQEKNRSDTMARRPVPKMRSAARVVIGLHRSYGSAGGCG